MRDNLPHILLISLPRWRPWGRTPFGWVVFLCFPALVLSACVGAETLHPGSVSMIAVRHRDGQTFVTWKEIEGGGRDLRYGVFRDTVGDGPASARLVMELGTGSGDFPREGDREIPPHPSFHQRRFIIESGAPELAPGVGLAVVTPHAPCRARYAIVPLRKGRMRESQSIVWTDWVDEIPAETQPILVWSSPDSLDRIYTQFMDAEDWNTNFEGQAYNFALRIPPRSAHEALPLSVILHGWDKGRRGYTLPTVPDTLPVVRLYIDDINCTWYYGFSIHAGAEHPPDGQDTIRNYTEERILRAVDAVCAIPGVRIDTNRITASGQSMGGTGALGLGLHYGSVFSAVYCSEPMANWLSSGAGKGKDWLPDVHRLWGPPHGNAVTIHRGPHSGPLRRWDGVNVWKWTNRIAMAKELASLEIAWLAIVHGARDRIIDAETQGVPLDRALSEAGLPFAAMVVDADHEWIDPSRVPGNWRILNTRFSRNHVQLAIRTHREDHSRPTDSSWSSSIEWSNLPDTITVGNRASSRPLSFVLHTPGEKISARVILRRFRDQTVDNISAWRWEAKSPGTGLSPQMGELQPHSSGFPMIERITLDKAPLRLDIIPREESRRSP